MPELQKDNLKISFRPSDEAMALLNRLAKQHSTNRTKVLALIADYAIQHEEEITKYLKQHEKYLNPSRRVE